MARTCDRREFLSLMGAWAAAGALGLPSPRSVGEGSGVRARRPNVVFILADDLGWRDTSLYGSTFYETPNLERLARRGMMFTNAYAANPLCSPTRASILTGQWPARIGITSPSCHLPQEKLEEIVADRAAPGVKVIPCQSATRLKQSYYTLAEALHDAGYRTAHFGKWHLGMEPYDPLHHGFDVDVPHWHGPGPAGSYLAPWRFPPVLKFAGEPGEHIEDRMAREAAKFIHENRERPFYLNYWHFSVHSPWEVNGVLQAKPELIAKYRKKADPNNPQHNPMYAAMVETLDAAVGTLLDTLDETGLAQNTIVVFFSDNGGVHFTEVDGAPVTSNAPLRGGKATIYEGGTREDCVVVWPGRVQPGSKSDAVIQSVDFYPTLLEMLNLKPQAGQSFDGISIVPALAQTGDLKRDAIFCHFPHATPATGGLPSVYVRQGDWKLIRFFHDGPDFAHRYELYNLKEDIGEASNLAARMPAKVKEMDALIEGFLKESGAVLPRPNPAYNPRLGEWTSSKDATVSVAGGLMVIEATGADPSVSTNDVPALSGEVTAEFRMRSTASGDGQVFWGAKGVRPLFFRDRSVLLKTQHDGEWHDYALKLPVQGEMTAFRLDPAAGKGRIEIDWIRLRGADGRVKKEWTFDRP